MTWSRHLFLFYFLKGKQNKKKKTLSVTPCFGKGGLWKTGSGLGVRLLIGKYGKDRSTPLSP